MKTTKTLTLLSAMTAMLVGTSSYADLSVRFIEGAPKDTFIIENTGKCALDNVVVDIDLASSDGKLFFDTTAAGAGVEVFQPFEVRSGQFTVANQSISDGNDAISLNVAQLAVGGNISFTIDVDDQLSNGDWGQIRISGSEINGAQARLTLADQIILTGTFGNNNRATIKTGNCRI